MSSWNQLHLLGNASSETRADRYGLTHNLPYDIDLDSSSTLPTCDVENVTEASNATVPHEHFLLIVLPYIVAVSYVITCLVGLVGNSLVIYVVLRFAKMKTVTNMYILNLALSDVLFLFMLPMTITTSMLKHWIFGFAMCKIYFVLYALNLFAGAFNLCFMSADRYLAVCHPIRSIKYRTPRIALFSCLCIWSLSFIVMLPIIMYSTTTDSPKFIGKRSCSIDWPSNQVISPDKAFIWYSFILGFAIPVALISVFYLLVILRLRHVGPAKKSKEKRKSHRRVTRLVLTVIAVYVICWFPYWCFQMRLVFTGKEESPSYLAVLIFNAISVLSIANSMLNPFLYAFLSDNFRKSFVKAFNCVSVQRDEDRKSNVANENSVYPRTSQTCTKNSNSTAERNEERLELSVMDGNSVAQPERCSSPKACQDEQGFLKPPVQL